MLYPNQLPGQHLGERAVLILHHHWYIFFRASVGFLLLLLLPLGLGWMFQYALPSVFDHPIIFSALTIALHIYVLAIWIFFANFFLELYLDVWIVTSSRVIDIEQHGLFARTISELHLDRIQDITTTSRGIAATTFGFGSITVTTAEAKERFQFQDMPDPEAVRTLIFKLVAKQKNHDRV